MTVVAFAEKNRAAAQIANILGDGDTKKIEVEGLPVYEFKWKGKDWLVMGLSGHIMNYDFQSSIINGTKLIREYSLELTL